MASNSIEPKIKKEVTNDIKQKKHVTIKLEPKKFGNVSSSASTSSMVNEPSIPITPNEKIVKHPNLKSIDNLNISKFILQHKQGGNDGQIDEDEQDETPTKPSGSKKHLIKSKEVKNDHPHSKQSIKRPKVTSSTIDKPVIKPKKFQPIEESIITTHPADELDLPKIFANIDDEFIKTKYVTIGSSKDFQSWCEYGFDLTNVQYGIISKIIKSRNKLNLKFGLILELINKYGESLEQQDHILNEKMSRLQNLGEEIKNFIN